MQNMNKNVRNKLTRNSKCAEILKFGSQLYLASSFPSFLLMKNNEMNKCVCAHAKTMRKEHDVITNKIYRNHVKNNWNGQSNEGVKNDNDFGLCHC